MNKVEGSFKKWVKIKLYSFPNMITEYGKRLKL